MSAHQSWLERSKRIAADIHASNRRAYEQAACDEFGKADGEQDDAGLAECDPRQRTPPHLNSTDSR